MSNATTEFEPNWLISSTSSAVGIDVSEGTDVSQGELSDRLGMSREPSRSSGKIAGKAESTFARWLVALSICTAPIAM